MRVVQLRRVRSWLVFFLLGGALPGCGCVLKAPLSNPVDAKPNKELFGAWKIDLPDKGPKDYGIVVVGNADLRGAPASVLKFVSLSSNNEDKINIGGSYFFTTSLATENYANILNQSFMEKDSPQTWDKARVGNWNLLKYSVDKDRLTIWFMNNKALEEAIGNKELKGIVEEKGSLFKTITITDSKELVRFLSNGGEMKIFTEETKRTFSRIK